MVSLAEAREKLLKGQVEFLTRLISTLTANS